jgi:outer membrane autotransporter protein
MTPRKYSATARKIATGSASILALALSGAIFTAPQSARAANECGIDGAGADTITCADPSYPNGITYAGSDGLNLVLDNSSMTVAKGTAANAINIGGNTANDITLTATNLTSVTGGAATAVTIANDGDGKAAVTINAGTFTANAIRTVTATHTSGAGDSVITMNGGLIANTFNTTSYSLDALTSGTGNATIVMTGGTVQSNGNSGSFALHAQITNAASSGIASITVTGGNTSGAGTGAFATTNGSGLALVSIDSAAIGTTGSSGVVASNTGSGDATARATNSSLSSGNIFTAATLRAQTNSGAALASATNSTLTAKGSSGAGIIAQSNTGSATASMTGGSLSNTAGGGVGVTARTGGAASATVLLDGGTVTTSGTTGHGLSAQSANGQAVVHMTDGTVKVTGNNADALFATVSGTGTYDINVSGGTLTGGLGTGAAIHANATNGGTIAIGANAIVNAGASGIALNVVGGAGTITTAGALTGNINLSNAAHLLTVTGGTIAGNINGGGASTLAFNLGTAGSFTYAAPYTVSAVDTVAMVSGTAAIDGAVSANSLAVHGGTMNLNATPAFANQVTVDGGVLAVNGTLTTPTMTVQNSGIVAMNGTTNAQVTALNGGTVHGNGTMGATTIQAGGIIAPGNSIGTLHVNGAFAANAGSIYQLEVDPASNASDLILVNGAATVASGAKLAVTANPSGAFQVGSHYTILTASGGVTGAYDTPAPISQYLGFKESQDANNIYLDFIQTGDPATAAQTGNQQAVAGGVPAGGTIGSTLLMSQSEADARDAFDKLSGEAIASTHGAIVSGGLLVRDTALDRLRDVCSADTVAGNPGCLNKDRPLVWVQGFGNWGRIGGNANAAALSHTTGGFLIGTDVPVYDWRLGFFAGYSRTDFEAEGVSSWGASDNYHLGTYAGTVWDGVALRMGASYSWNALSTERLVSFGGFSNDLTATYNAGTAQIFGEVAESFAFDRMNLEPFANLSYMNLRTYAFREGGGEAALSSEANTQEDTFTTIGLRPSTDFSIFSIPLRAKGMFGWRHTFGTVTPDATVSFAGGNAFTVTGAPIARDAGVVEAGLSTNVTESAAINLTYGAQFGGRESNNGLRGTLAVAF